MKTNKARAGYMKKISIQNFLIHLAIGVLVVLTFYPFLFMVITSLKSIPQFLHNFWGLAYPLHLENYQSAYNVISRYVFNSILVSLSTAAGVVTLGCLTSYVFARFVFPGKKLLFFLILSVMMVPGVLTLVPTFMVVKDLGLINSRWALILPYITGGQILAIFLLRSFFETIPGELFDSATVDGAHHLHIIQNIIIPLSKPILGVVIIMDILGTWNNFIWPLVTLNDSRYFVLPIGLFSFAGQFGTRYGEMFAGYVIASLPLIVLFAFTTRTFLKGITSGAVKM